MREIKFRAWDKENNKMIYSNEVYPSSSYKFEFELLDGYKFILSKIVDRINTKDNLGNEHIVECFEKVDAEIMQYTGIKDDEGNEIYEGDIVEISNGSSTEFLGMVSFDDGIFTLNAKERFCYMSKHRILKMHSYRILGNIYENKELEKKHEFTRWNSLNYF